MPAVDMNQIEKEDIRRQEENKPYRFGVHIPVKLGLDNAGEWLQLDNGDRIWRLTIRSNQAKGLQLLYSDFYIPTGGRVFLYTPDREQVLGAYTSRNNKVDGKFATSITYGDQVIIEYVEPAAVKGQGRLVIEKIVHAYRGIRSALDYG